MKQLLHRSLYLLLPFILLTACAKDDSRPDEETPPQTNPGSFSWSLSNGQTLNADSAFAYGSITTIYAFKGGNSNSIEVNLLSLSPGTYPISPATGNAFTYMSSNTTYTGTAGSFVISASANSKLSGSFSISLAGGALTSINGSFTDIQKR